MVVGRGLYCGVLLISSKKVPNMITNLRPDTSNPNGGSAQGVLDDATGLILTSGQLALSVDGTTPVSIEAQSELIFSNIDAILGAAGADRGDVLQVKASVTKRDYVSGFVAMRDLWIKDIPHLPAVSLTIVSGFIRPEFLVEVDVVARKHR